MTKKVVNFWLREAKSRKRGRRRRKDGAEEKTEPQPRDEEKKQSKNRVDNSPLFGSIETRKKWQRENKIKLLDLNLQSRVDEKNKIEQFYLSNENSLRVSLNLPTFSTYKEFVERDEDPDILNIDSEVLGEAANILIDLIEIKEKPLLAQIKRAS